MYVDINIYISCMYKYNVYILTYIYTYDQL